MIILITSFNVVMNGPEATAGSIFIRCMNNGMNEPEMVATKIETKIAAPTNKAMMNSCFQMKIKPTTKTAQTNPGDQTRSRFSQKQLEFAFILNIPSCNPRTATASA